MDSRSFFLVLTILVGSGMNPFFHTFAQQLQMPEIPSMLVEPKDRAGYLIEHYWDHLDFSDRTLTSNADFIEQTFVNFLTLFHLASDEAARSGVRILLTRASVDANCYKELHALAEKYLYEPNSPMLNEQVYALFLEQFRTSRHLTSIERSHVNFQYAVIQKNRVGTKAADFKYITRENQTSSLHQTVAARLLLIFYDPECEHCNEILIKLSSHKLLNSLIQSGVFRVLAVNIDGDRQVWEQHLPQMPLNWSVAFATSEVQSRGIYVLRAMPTLYLLDEQKVVLVKDLLPEQLDAWL